ncbi:L-cysteine desulfidase family protein [Geomonas agri]|uniref:L-cysteine desulfidase family protein n=1 Tax=Geomonas agri TaxID=2873702 RepID=UPI001CD64A03|nr:L-serine ammonia-lyase, iron-sulfur-dependent, subunit alpha [Geomonas agri]
MSMYHEVIKHEVFPALGCTEPIAVAYAASLAAAQLDGELEQVTVSADAGVFKNGFAVTVPETGGVKGNVIAAALGALIARPELKMEILSGTRPELLQQAKLMVSGGQAAVSLAEAQRGFYIDATVVKGGRVARAVLAGGHTNLVRLERDGEVLLRNEQEEGGEDSHQYRAALKQMTLAQLVDLLEDVNREDLVYLKRGVEMNLRVAEAGKELTKVGYYVEELVRKGFLLSDVVSSSKILTASASDARMAGLSYPVMSSGGSGNQGIVAILVPYNVGLFFRIPEETILKSIALSHLVNAYIKCHTGDLAPICGCAIAAGVGAAVAIVYQQAGKDIAKMNLAVNTIISDIGGMLCDGAKGGCALKVVSSTDASIRAAYMALSGHGITEEEGFVGRSAEETIRNLSRITDRGMSLADETMLHIMLEKQGGATS